MAKSKTNDRSTDEKPGQMIVRANVARKVEKSDGFVSIYANDTQVQLSPWDVRLVFGVIDGMPTSDGEDVVVKLLGEVRLSLPHAKRVAQILVQQLSHYEAVTKVPIPLPE